MSEFTKRVLFSVPAAIITLWATWLGHWFFFGLAFVLMCFMQHEMKRIAARAGFHPDPFFPYSVGLYILLIPVLPYVFEIGIAIFLLFVVLQVFKKRETHIPELITTFFCSAYIPFGLLCVILIRNSGTDETGFILTIAFLLMIWGNDVFAYMGGTKWGRHLMAPSISPSKTWEGFLFGFSGAAIGLIVTIAVIPFEFSFNWLILLPATALISIFGPLGDLLESKLKRAAEVKDASTILPGHGGFFDRLDAVILAAPAFYLYIRGLQIAGHLSF